MVGRLAAGEGAMDEDAMKDLFDLTGRVAVITGGAGLLGYKHAEVIARAGGIPVLVDLAAAQPETKAADRKSVV